MNGQALSQIVHRGFARSIRHRVIRRDETVQAADVDDGAGVSQLMLKTQREMGDGVEVHRHHPAPVGVIESEGILI